MPNIALAAYSVRVRPKYSSESLTLDSFRPGKDLLGFFAAYFADLQASPLQDTARNTLLRIGQMKETKRTLYGKLESGDYGYETDLVDVSTESISYHRTTMDAELRPFFYSILLPSGQDEGILLLERQGNIGVFSQFTSLLRAAFRKQHPEHVLDFKALVPEGVIEELVESGLVKKLRFVRFAIPYDIADAYDLRGHEEGSTELVIRAARRRGFDLIGPVRELFQRGGKGGVLELQDGAEFHYDTIKMEIAVGRRTRTLDVSNLGRVRAYHDIGNQVEIGPDGHPTLSSIKAQADDLLDDLEEALYGERSR